MALVAPFEIATIPLSRGAIGLSMAPGRRGWGLSGINHKRDLDEDLDTIMVWGANVVLTLMTMQELRECRIACIGKKVRNRSMIWLHMPIKDVSVPDAKFDYDWPLTSALLRSVPEEGGRVFIHCRGGLGRAGMITARLLVDSGMQPHKAIAKVRSVRGPLAIETTAQELWVERS